MSAIIQSPLRFSLQLNRQQKLPNGIQGRDVIRRLSRRILRTRIGAVFINEKLYDLESVRSLRRHARVMQGRASRVIGLFHAHARLAH